MSGKTASRVERVIAFYGLDHLCWSEESVEEDLRDPDDFVRELAADAARYRYIRAHSYVEVRCDSPRDPDWRPDRLDAEVDAAMQQAPERG